MSESNPIRVFATHTFEETDDYLRIFEFLESADRFYYLNVSRPENIPESTDPQTIRDELIRTDKTGGGYFRCTRFVRITTGDCPLYDGCRRCKRYR